MKKISIIPLLLSIIIMFTACGTAVYNAEDGESNKLSIVETTTEVSENIAIKSITDATDLPEYTDSAYIQVNNNVPDFDKGDYTTKSFEKYGKLDSLGRCTTAYACIGQDLMPTEERGAIGSVKPTGWHTVKYNNVDGKYLYNRCHLIGYQLTAENANVCNLITGTRYLNIEGMLPFENEVADYIESTNNHVLYRVTPIFKGDNLLASGVLMEAYSVEDKGKGVEFCVYCYNVQPDITIDYATGDSYANDQTYNYSDEGQKYQYIVNTNTKKFHKPECSAVDKIKSKNKKTYTGTRESLINNGYTPCKQCNP